MREEIKKLAQIIFEKDELKEIRALISDYQGSDTKFRKSLSRLRYVIPSRPKRPMYYVHYQIGFLPDSSRFVVEQSGSYLDLLVKEFRYEIFGKYKAEPLGKNVRLILDLGDKIDSELVSLVKKILVFNEAIYVPAKHKYGLPNDARHYFEIDDSIIVTLIATKLGEEIKKRSEFARKLCRDLVLPAQQEYIGNHEPTDKDGSPFDFKNALFESKQLPLDRYGRVMI